MSNVYKNENRGKLLVAILAMFMVIAGAAVVLSEDSVAATTAPEGSEVITADVDFSDLTPGNYELKSTYTIEKGKEMSVGDGVHIYITGEGKIVSEGKLTFQNGSSIRFDQYGMETGTSGGTIIVESGAVVSVLGLNVVTAEDIVGSENNSVISLNSGSIVIDKLVKDQPATFTLTGGSQAEIGYGVSMVSGAMNLQMTVNTEEGSTITTEAGKTYALGSAFTLNNEGTIIFNPTSKVSCQGTINNSGSLSMSKSFSGDITNTGVVFGIAGTAYKNTVDGQYFTVPEGTTASYDSATKTVTVEGQPVVADKDDTTWKALFESAKGDWAYMGINNLSGTVTITQVNTALGQAWSLTDFPGNTKSKEYTFNSSDSYFFLVPKDNSDVTVKINETTYTFRFDVEAVKELGDNTDAAAVSDAFGQTDVVRITGSISNDASLEIPADKGKTLEIPSVTNATFSVKIGDNVVEFSGVTGKDIVITQGSISLYGKDLSGEIAVKGTMKLEDGTTVANGAKFTADASNPGKIIIPQNAKVTFDGTVSLNNVNMDIRGTVASATSTKATVTVGAGSSVTFVGNPGVDFVAENGGVITNNNESWSTITLNDGTEINADSSIIASANQQVIIAGDVTIVDGGKIDISGELIVQQGATLTVEKGGVLNINSSAKADVAGDIVIEGGANTASFTYAGNGMTVSGTLTIEGANAFACNGSLSVSGTMNIEEEATVAYTGVISVLAGGNLNVSGAIDGKVSVAGTVTVDSEAVCTVTAQMKDGGVLDLQNLNGTATVSDSEMEYKIEGKPATIDDKANEMTVTGVSGVVVSEKLEMKTDEEGNRYADNHTYLAGAAEVAKDINGDVTTSSIDISKGTVEVSEDLTVGEKVKVTVTGTLFVSGTVTAVEEQITGTGTGTVTVTGTVKTKSDLKTTNVNAARYDVKENNVTYNIYTTLENAVAANATDIEVLGNISVKADLTIPAGTTVDASKKGKEITIDEGVTLTVAYTDGTAAKLRNGNAQILVNGTLVAENLKKSLITESTVISDVSSKTGDSATYTNIYLALSNAQSGETVKITRGGNGTVTLERNITVNEGVTLEIPEGKTVVVPAGITDTVNGTLSFENGTYTMNKEDGSKEAAKTVVNGLLETDSTADYVSKIAGAYFTLDNLACIAPMDFVADNIDKIESDVTVRLEVTAGDITVAYTGDEPRKIVIDAGADFTASTLTLSGVGFEFNGRTNATVVMNDATFVLENVTEGVVSDSVSFEQDNTEVHTSVLTGKIANAVNKNTTSTSTMYYDGKVTVSGTARIAAESVGSAFVIAADSTVQVGDVDFNGETVVEGTAVLVASGATFKDLTVLGAVTVEQDESWTATINGVMYVGFTAEDLGIETTGAAASVNGILLGASNTNAVAYVANGSTVSDSIAKATGIKTTEYYSDDVLFATAYTLGTVNIDKIGMAVENAEFVGWFNADGKAATTYKDNQPVDQQKIGATGFDKVYAKVNYNVYNVVINTDGGISSVAIDNNLMTQQYGGNSFYVNGLTAGQHTVTYTLKSGYTGTAVLTSDSVTVNGMSFTLSGDFDEAFVLNLAGTEPSNSTVIVDNGGDSGMGLTDYLLIVLVVLIVIMAIIVAMRLMRS